MMIEVELGETLINPDNDFEKLWLENEILATGERNLILHSNELGDEVGVITKRGSVTWIIDNEDETT